MKLLRVGAAGEERPAALTPDGLVRDLSSLVDDIGGEFLLPSSIAALRAVDFRQLPEVEPNLRIGPCVGGVGKFICIGLNYMDHAREANLPLPTEPIIFQKAVTAISGPNDPIIRPPGSKKLDWEVELGVVIGSRAKTVSPEEALANVCGYCLINDVSERHFQLERGGQWTKGKSFDSFGPIGPWMVTADEVEDPQALRLWLEVDGVRRQHGTTGDMVFKVRDLVSYVSQFMTLLPGDVIATGTPAGVGVGIRPEPVFLRDGQIVRLGIDGLGEQRQLIGAGG